MDVWTFLSFVLLSFFFGLSLLDLTLFRKNYVRNTLSCINFVFQSSTVQAENIYNLYDIYIYNRQFLDRYCLSTFSNYGFEP